MGRPRTFSQDEVLRLAARVFMEGGYEGTSVDDLVQALNLHRGSLYKAFGSKRGLFLAVLERYVRSAISDAVQAALNGDGDILEELTTGNHVDLLLIAAVERGHHDPQVAALVRTALAQLAGVAEQIQPVTGLRGHEVGAAAILGVRLARRLLPAEDLETAESR